MAQAAKKAHPIKVVHSQPKKADDSTVIQEVAKMVTIEVTKAVTQSLNEQVDKIVAEIKELLKDYKKQAPALAAVESTGRTRTSYPRVGRGVLTPSEDFYKPILQVLENNDGIVTHRRIFNELPKILSFNSDDENIIQSTDKPSWHSTVYKARSEMKAKGWIAHTGWKITTSGRNYLKK